MCVFLRVERDFQEPLSTHYAPFPIPNVCVAFFAFAVVSEYDCRMKEFLWRIDFESAAMKCNVWVIFGAEFCSSGWDCCFMIFDKERKKMKLEWNETLK